MFPMSVKSRKNRISKEDTLPNIMVKQIRSRKYIACDCHLGKDGFRAMVGPNARLQRLVYSLNGMCSFQNLPEGNA